MFWSEIRFNEELLPPTGKVLDGAQSEPIFHLPPSNLNN